MEEGSLLVEDLWLTEVLDRPAYRILLPETEAEFGSLCPTVRRATESDLSGSAFAFGKVPTHSYSGIRFMESLGFHLVDTNVTFARDAGSGEEPEGVRFAGPDDRVGVVELAGRAFEMSRFHLDERIPGPLADRIKAEWTANFFRGDRGDAMVVAEDGGAITGFLLLLDRGGGEWVIDLVAVDPERRSRGAGSRMISFFESRTPECRRLLVGTQVANIGSIRFYERNGFRMTASDYVFHYHGPSVTGSEGCG